MESEKSSLTQPGIAPMTQKEQPVPAGKISTKDEIVSRIVEDQPSLFKMLRTSLFAGTVEQAKEHVFKSIFEPDIKAMMFNAIVAFMSVWVFGDDRSRRANSVSAYYRSSLDNNNRDYAAMARNGGQNEQRSSATNPAEVKDIVFETREMAEKVADDLLTIMKENGGYVSVYKYYELCHIKMSDLYWPQKEWGWTNLDNLGVYQDAEGFHISVPRRAENLNRAIRRKNVK